VKVLLAQKWRPVLFLSAFAPLISLRALQGYALLRQHILRYGICRIRHRGMPLSRVMVEEDAADVWWKPPWKIVRLRFIFDLLLVSIVAVIGITIGL